MQIPPIQGNQEFLHAINYAWSYTPTHYGSIQGYVIFFDQEYGYREVENKQKDLLQFISECVGKERIAIKLHPKSKDFKYGKQYIYFNYNYPMELIALNENIENNIFISLQSSAAINLKTMLHMSSTVIMLSNLVKWPKGIYATANNVIKKLDLQDNNFFVPDTKEQLKDILKK